MSLLNPNGYKHEVYRYRTGGTTLGIYRHSSSGAVSPANAAKCRCGWESRDRNEIFAHESLAAEERR